MPWPHQTPKRTEPYTEAELLDMYRGGDPVSSVIARAAKVNGWGRAKVREIIFGKAF